MKHELKTRTDQRFASKSPSKKAKESYRTTQQAHMALVRSLEHGVYRLNAHLENYEYVPKLMGKRDRARPYEIRRAIADWAKRRLTGVSRSIVGAKRDNPTHHELRVSIYIKGRWSMEDRDALDQEFSSIVSHLTRGTPYGVHVKKRRLYERGLIEWECQFIDNPFMLGEIQARRIIARRQQAQREKERRVYNIIKELHKQGKAKPFIKDALKRMRSKEERKHLRLIARKLGVKL